MLMYGNMLSGKYWYLELQEYASKNMHCLFIQLNEDGSKNYLLNYVDDNGMDGDGVK